MEEGKLFQPFSFNLIGIGNYLCLQTSRQVGWGEDNDTRTAMVPFVDGDGVWFEPETGNGGGEKLLTKR